MTDDLTGDLDLLGDWLDAKGYGEEAGLCTRVMDHMHKQDARIAALEAALKPFADMTAEAIYDQDRISCHWKVIISGVTPSFEYFDKARAALEDK